MQWRRGVVKVVGVMIGKVEVRGGVMVWGLCIVDVSSLSGVALVLAEFVMTLDDGV